MGRPQGTHRITAGRLQDGRRALAGWPQGVRGMATGRPQDGRRAFVAPFHQMLLYLHAPASQKHHTQERQSLLLQEQAKMSLKCHAHPCEHHMIHAWKPMPWEMRMRLFQVCWSGGHQTGIHGDQGSSLSGGFVLCFLRHIFSIRHMIASIMIASIMTTT